MEITRKFEFATAHRLQDHEGVCANLHGHNYQLEVSVATEVALDKIGRVVDFSELKKIVNTFLDANLDHTTIYKEGDPVMEQVSLVLESYGLKKPLAFEKNPTVEVMAQYILGELQKRMPSNIIVTQIKLYETSNSFVVVRC